MNRQNKSHLVIETLKQIAGAHIRAPNPYQKDLIESAEHIEWLELLVTGITVKDRNSIVALKRQQRRGEAKIIRRDTAIDVLRHKMKAMKKHFDSCCEGYVEDIERLEAREYQITPEMREVVEQEYIEKLKTSSDGLNQQAMINYYKRLHNSASSSYNRRWKY